MVHDPSTSQAIAYLPDPEDLALTFEDWPSDVALALYLEPEGRCAAVPFCPAEKSRIGTRLAQIFERNAAQIGVFPSLPDHPDVALLYSDEQALLAMLREVDPAKVVGPARDYALNYQFAEEEGLDPLKLVRSIRIPLSGENTDASEQTTSAEKPPVEKVPKPIETAEVPPDTPPAGFLRLEPKDRDRCSTTSGVFYLEADGQLVIAPVGSSGAPISLPELDVFVRDDFKGLALTVPKNAPKTAIWALPIERVPAALMPTLGKRKPVELNQVGRNVFIKFPKAPTIPPSKPMDHLVKPTPSEGRSKPKRSERKSTKQPTHRRRHDVTEIPPRLRYRMEQTQRKSRLRGGLAFVTLLLAVSGTVVLALG